MTEGENTTRVGFGRSFVPGSGELGSFVWTAVLLSGLLVGVVPVVSLTMGVPARTVAGVVGAVYLAILIATGTTFEGVASAGLVLSIFDMTLVAAPAPGVSTFRLMAVDIVVVPLLVVLLYERPRAVVPRRFSASAIAAAGLVVFVVWSFVSVGFGSGVSELAALAFAVEQLRYLVLFGFAALLADRVGPRCVLYPLVVSMAGNFAFSIAEIVHGGVFGLSTLGEKVNRYMGTFSLAGVHIESGFYAGGFVGHGRELALIGLLFVPLVLAAGLSQRRRYLPVAVVAALAGVLSIRVANTDAGWAALILILALFALYLIYAGVSGGVRRFAGRYSSVAGFGAVGLVAVAAVYLVYRIAGAIQTSGPHLLIFSTSSLSIRFQEYAVALAVAIQHPVFGLGGDNFRLMATSFGLPEPLGVHNTLLSNLAATGFVGFVAYAVCLIAVFWVVLRRILVTGGGERLLWVGVCCGIIGFQIYAFFSTAYTWTSANAAFWVVAGAVIGSNVRPNSIRMLGSSQAETNSLLS